MITRNSAKSGFYYLGLLLCTISTSLIGRTYLFLIPYLNPILKLGSISCFLISFMSRRWKKQDLFKFIVMIAAVLAVVIATDSNLLFIYILAIGLSKPGDFDKICRFLFWANLCIFIIVVGLCGIGVLNDEITTHNGLTAHSLGYAYYNSPAYSILFLTLLAYYLYSGRRYSQKRVLFFVISTIANCVIYKLTTVRLTFYSYLIFIGLIVLYEYIGLIRKIKLNRVIGTVMYPFMFLMGITLPFIYTRSSVLVKLDSALNGRFYFSMLGFTRYKVNLFGNQIITNAGGFNENWKNTYFFIDSGYVKTLLGYGLIITLVVLFVYTMVSRYAAQTKNPKLFIWCVLVCIFAFINDPLTDIILNPLLFITVPLFYEIRQKHKLSKVTGVKRKNIKLELKI